MSDLKPIETAYNGYRFRSRLEARWAVWFDAMGIKYHYEAEGFDLDGLYYLPDFYLPEWNAYIEIKPARRLEPDEVEKVVRLSDFSKKKVFLISGQPYFKSYVVLYYTHDQEDQNSVSGCQFAECRKGCGEVWLVGEFNDWAMPINSNPECHTDKWPLIEYSELLTNAFNAARSSRFEHGVSPNPFTQERARILREQSDYSGS